MSKFILSCFADEISPMLNEQIDVLKKTDIRHIEMRGVDNQNISDINSDKAKEVKKVLDSEGFKISSLGSPIGKININDPFEPHLDKFKQTLETAAILDSKFIRMFSFYIDENADFDSYKDQVVERWFKFIDVAKNYDVTLLHENEHGIYGNIARRNLELIKALNSDRVALVFDPANYVLDNETTFPYAYELTKDYIKYFHIKDAILSDKKVVPAGSGDGKVKEVLQAAKNNNYSGFVSIEPHLGKFEGLAAFEHNLDISSMPKGGPQLFMIAYYALKEIIESLD